MKKFIIYLLISFVIIVAAVIYFKQNKTLLNFDNGKSFNKQKNTKGSIYKMENFKKYEVQEQLRPSGLNGISDGQINDHWGLYKGYVAQVNKLNDELSSLSSEGKADSLLYADRRRRYAFEYNGMVLHEYYFGNLTSNAKVLGESEFKKALEKTWGSFDSWLQDFINTGKTRGIGWAILYLDPNSGQLLNVFVAEHQNGHISGFVPILVMDIWEHAYMVDHKAGGRGDYISAFIKNIDWDEVENRFKKYS